MADRMKMTTIAFSLGGELLDAVNEGGRTKVLPVTFQDDSGARSINVPVEAGPADGGNPIPSPPRLRLVR